jgi:hypothetical protein
MRKTLAALACLLCLTTIACKPQQAAHGVMREQRMEKHGENGGHGGLRRSCRADIEQFCAADQKGRDRRECLQSHMDKLSADCKTALQDRMNHKGGGHKNRDKSNTTNGGTTDKDDDN